MPLPNSDKPYPHNVWLKQGEPGAKGSGFLHHMPDDVLRDIADQHPRKLVKIAALKILEERTPSNSTEEICAEIDALENS